MLGEPDEQGLDHHDAALGGHNGHRLPLRGLLELPGLAGRASSEPEDQRPQRVLPYISKQSLPPRPLDDSLEPILASSKMPLAYLFGIGTLEHVIQVQVGGVRYGEPIDGDQAAGKGCHAESSSASEATHRDRSL
ncbi:MAG: hypothetical protein AMXMBFR58_11730 [Phycisphaerae bacterium]